MVQYTKKIDMKDNKINLEIGISKILEKNLGYSFLSKEYSCCAQHIV